MKMSGKKARSILRAGNKPGQSGDIADSVRSLRARMPLDASLWKMANKLVPEPLKRKPPRLTLSDIERLRPAFLQATRERKQKEFLKKLSEERGHSAHWWHNAFSGYVRLDNIR
jgi:hypothetical protein